MVITSIICGYKPNPITMVIPIIHLEFLGKISTDPKKMVERGFWDGTGCRSGGWLFCFFLMLDFEMFDCYYLVLACFSVSFLLRLL